MIEIFENSYLILLVLAISIAIDLIFGELPTEVHPVVIIGKFINYLLKRIINIKRKLTGFLLTAIVSISTIFVAEAILVVCSSNIYFFILILSLALSSTFSIKLLLKSATGIKRNLEKRIEIARRSMKYLVSRDTKKLSERLIISATIESLSENITDSFISPIFYYLLSGAIILGIASLNIIKLDQIAILSIPFLIAIFYRVVNTLDAMVGYKNDKFLAIGYFPAKLDDILNFIPARFTGFIIVISAFLLGMNWRNSYFILKRDARTCPSPNSGFTMAATAGALDIQLEKQENYIIGNENKKLEKEDIVRAINLAKIAISLSIIVLVILFLLFLFIFII
jgi:adenosylcobinamide-phosphate synthase